MEDPSFRTLFVCQVHILLFSDSVDGVVHAHADVLGIIAKALAEQRCAAHMTRIFRDFNAEGDRASGTDADIADGRVTDATAIHKGALFIDGEQFKQTVLVPVWEPPGRVVDSADPSEVAGAGPETEVHTVDLEMNIQLFLNLLYH